MNKYLFREIANSSEPLSIAFVILVYKFSSDVSALVKSLKDQFGSAVVQDIFIVENFSSDKSKEEVVSFCEEVKVNYCGTFPNNGYGAGNNIGIRHAFLCGYDFISVLNPDTLLYKFPTEGWGRFEGSIVGPKITRTNKSNQNPYWAYKSHFLEYLIYQSAKRRNKFLLYCGVIGHKILKLYWVIYNFCFRKQHEVFALHGSAIIFSRNVVESFGIVFDEKLFLYTEEEDLAYSAESYSIPMLYRPDIVLMHTEDGSSNGILPPVLSHEICKSIIYRYEKWHL